MRNSKKYFVIILAILLVVVMAFTLTCCNKKKQEQQKKQEDKSSSVAITTDDDFDVQDDGTLFCDVDNNIGKFSLKGKFSVKTGAILQFFKTSDGVELGDEIKDLNIPLVEGENTIFAVVTKGNESQTYKIVIYRKKHFTVEFKTPNGEVPSQTVLEGERVASPEIIPEDLGYQFAGWDFDFSQPINENIVIQSKWNPNEYNIKFDADGGEMEQYFQVVHYGEDVKLPIPTKAGYKFLCWKDEKGNQISSGVWKRMSDVTLKAFWDLQTYEVTINVDLNGAGNILGEGTGYKFNSAVDLEAVPFKGYRFDGWYYAGNKVSDNPKYHIDHITSNIRWTAKFYIYEKAMEPFYFYTEDEQSYRITGIRDLSMTNLVIPAMVDRIQKGALNFSTSDPLTSLTIPFIGTCKEDAKNNKSLYSMFANGIPSSLKTVHVTGECYVDKNTFYDSYYSWYSPIENLIFDDVRRIESEAFKYMQNLKSLKVSESIEYINNCIFDGYYDNGQYIPYRFTAFNDDGNGGLYLGNDENPYIVLYKEKTVNSSNCVINDGTKLIAESAFYNSYNDSTLLTVTFPEGLKYIGERAFQSRPISPVDFSEITELKFIGEDAFYYSLRDDTNPFELSFGNKLEEIGDRAFGNCYAISEVTLPNSLVKLGQQAFEYCSKLSIVNFGSGLKTIEQYTFGGCKFSEIGIPDTIETIDFCAFQNCNDLATIHIGKGLKNISSDTFAGSTEVRSISIDEDNPNLYGTNCIIEKYTNRLIYCAYQAEEIKVPDGTERIDSGLFNGYYIKKVIIPASVKYIGAYAFSNCHSLGSVIFDDGSRLEEIGDYAFFDCKLGTINIPSGVKKIGDYAFKGCSLLESISISEGVEEIGSYVFNNCSSLTELTIPRTVKKIGNYLFSTGSSNNSLEKLVIEDGDEELEIGDYAFYYCSNLKDVSIPDRLKRVGMRVFYQINPDAFTFEDNIYYLGNDENPYVYVEEFTTYYSYSSTVVLKEGVKCIDLYAFYNCYYGNDFKLTIPNEDEIDMSFLKYANFTSKYENNIFYRGTTNNPYYYVSRADYGCSFYEINSGAKIIGDSAFYGYSNLQGITIPSTVVEIGNSAFYNCYNLQNVSIPGSVKIIGDYAFYGCSYLSLSDTAISEGVEKIGDYAFYGCSNLNSIKIPGSVKEIGNSAFRGCSNLQNVTINNGVKKIGNYAFAPTNTYSYNCTNLWSIKIPESVEEIGDYAFYNSHNASVNLAREGNLKKIGSYAFYRGYGDDKYCSVVIPASVEEIGDYAFYFWNSSSLSFDSNSQLKKIGNYAFYYCNSLSISLEEDSLLEKIGSYAFYNCRYLYDITIPGGVEEIGDHAFYNCYNMSSLTIKDGVKKIGSYAFYYCNSLRSVGISASVEEIGTNAFYNCYNLNEITFAEDSHLKKIGSYAFEYCNNLQSITIPDSVEEIGSDAFNGCSNLNTLTIGSGIKKVNKNVFVNQYSSNYNLCNLTLNCEEIGEYAFNYCYNLATLTFLENVKIIGRCAFESCRMNSLVIPGNVKTIGENAFNNCSNLNTLTIEEGVEEIGNYAFAYCYNLEEIYIPISVTSFGRNMLYNCKNLETIHYAGTRMEWDIITKGNDWNDTDNAFKVICADGAVIKYTGN